MAPTPPNLIDAGRKPSYDDVMRADSSLQRMLAEVEIMGFTHVHGVPVSPEATRALLERVGPLFPSLFGDFWEFTNDQSFVDLAYTNKAIALHTDGTYYPEPPRLEVFHCLHFDGEGGHSLLSDGFVAAERLRSLDPEAFDVLTDVRVPARYLDGDLDSHAEHPVLALQTGRRLHRVCFNPYDRQPFTLAPPRRRVFDAAWTQFEQHVATPDTCHRFRLEPGIALIFDNWRMLHAREAFTGQRRLCGAYVANDVFEDRVSGRTNATAPAEQPR